MNIEIVIDTGEIYHIEIEPIYEQVTKEHWNDLGTVVTKYETKTYIDDFRVLACFDENLECVKFKPEWHKIVMEKLNND